MQHWTAVQVADPELAPLATYFVAVEIETQAGVEFRKFKVRAPAGVQHTEELEGLAVAYVRKLGFITTGKAKHE